MTQTVHQVLPIEPIPYGPPSAKQSTRVWAGIAILFGGLGLLVIGGCFLMGVMQSLSYGVGFGGPTPPAPSSPALTTLICVLYALAFLSFAGGATLLVMGARALLRIING